MSARYLILCSCGESVAVAPSQSGGSATCQCGASIDVPRLGELRKLPQAPDDQPTRRSGWSPAQGALSAGLILSALFASAAGWLIANEPQPPEPFDAETREAFVEERIAAMQPLELWQMHTFIYEPLAKTGLTKQEAPGAALLNEQVQQSRLYQYALWAAAAATAVIGVITSVLLPR